MATSYTTDPIKVIDVDSHYSPPPGFWEAHAPAKFKERVPRIGEDEQGMPEWLVDGKPFDLTPYIRGKVARLTLNPDQ